MLCTWPRATDPSRPACSPRPLHPSPPPPLAASTAGESPAGRPRLVPERRHTPRRRPALHARRAGGAPSVHDAGRRGRRPRRGR